jgi:hypothetical protein
VPPRCIPKTTVQLVTSAILQVNRVGPDHLLCHHLLSMRA